MFRILVNSRRLFHLKRVNQSLRRCFLSEAYKCTEAWENRLKSRIFQKADQIDLYVQLRNGLQRGTGISVLDVDIFVNMLKDESALTDLKDILIHLRAQPETSIMYESTSQAVIRLFLSLGKIDELLEILNKRLEFGIFPDYYLSNWLMDTCLKNNDFVSAAKVAVLQMLQEDFNHPIMKPLALHSCYKYLNSTQVWEVPKESDEDEDEDEDEERENRVRVPFLRNPYFDDHFDLTEPNHLVGKTLTLCGRAFTEPIGISSQVIGLTLYEKFNENIALLQSVLKENNQIHSEAVEKAKEYINRKPKQPQNSETGEKEVENPEAGEKEIENPEITAAKEELLKLLGEIEKKGKLIKANLQSETENYVKEKVKQHEEEDIKQQCEIYKQWEEHREKNIQLEIEEKKRQQVKEEIEKVQQEIILEEEEVFYFDNEDKWELLAEQKKVEKENVQYFKARGLLKKRYGTEGEEYVPPQVKQKRHTT